MLYNVYYYEPNIEDSMDVDWKIKKPTELQNPKIGDLISAKRQSGNIGKFIIQAVMDDTIYVSEIGVKIYTISRFNVEKNKLKA